MTAYVALLRAVNVGGTGKLPMSELEAMCETAGFEKVKTYIASGNVVFTSGMSEAEVKAALEKALPAYAGKPVGVMVRTRGRDGGGPRTQSVPRAPGNRAWRSSWMKAARSGRRRRCKSMTRRSRWASARSTSATPTMAWASPSWTSPPPRPAPRAT